MGRTYGLAGQAGGQFSTGSRPDGSDTRAGDRHCRAAHEPPPCAPTTAMPPLSPTDVWVDVSVLSGTRTRARVDAPSTKIAVQTNLDGQTSPSKGESAGLTVCDMHC